MTAAEKIQKAIDLVREVIKEVDATDSKHATPIMNKLGKVRSMLTFEKEFVEKITEHMKDRKSPMTEMTMLFKDVKPGNVIQTSIEDFGSVDWFPVTSIEDREEFGLAVTVMTNCGSKDPVALLQTIIVLPNDEVRVLV